MTDELQNATEAKVFANVHYLHTTAKLMTSLSHFLVNVPLLSLQVSIVPRTNAALGFTQYTTTDKKLYSEVEVTNIDTL